ncbi:DUF3307 domain-containing protein [Bacillus sp. H-16]|uniref:DUF3307 domain-containing protein n=1 Tax=Alteribacter salitolerans TaxID=2912333 RepID=UPI00196266C1|nr:DUF3307 domain-containing protein [Alteribacter salitolerans]
MWLWILFGHLLCDFLFQSDRLIDLKRKNIIKGLLAHSFIHVNVYVVLLMVYWFIYGGSISLILLAAALIAIIHFFIDYLKIRLVSLNQATPYQAGLFVLDQVFHVISILLVLTLLGLGSFSFSGIYDGIVLFSAGAYPWETMERVVALGCIIVIGTYGAGYFLGILLKDFTPKDDIQKNHYTIANEKTEVRTRFLPNGEKESEMVSVKTEQLFKDSPQKIGRYIGMLERLLIIFLLLVQLPHGLAFLAALKSLTRFKQFDNKQFAEYYLIGTFSSSLIGIVLGVLALGVLQ